MRRAALGAPAAKIQIPLHKNNLNLDDQQYSVTVEILITQAEYIQLPPPPTYLDRSP